MANRVATENVNDVVTTFAREVGLNPTEGMRAASFVHRPEVDGKFGQTVKVRKIVGQRNTQAVSNSSSATFNVAGMTFNANVDEVVTGTSGLVYNSMQINRNVWNQIRDDATFRAGYRKMLLAGMEEKLETDVLANAVNLSNTVVNADLTDDVLRTLAQKLRISAMDKYRFGESDVRLYVDTSEFANALGIATIKEYQIRGNLGAAASGQMVNAYGIKWDVSTLVYKAAGSAYNPLMLSDASFLVFNEELHMLADQQNGIADILTAVMEYATGEYFDSSGAVAVTTV